MKISITTEARYFKNFVIYSIFALLLIIGLVSTKSYLNLVEPNGYQIGALIIFLKVFLKFLPLGFALLTEYLLASKGNISLKQFLRWKKTSVIDLYCFIVHNFYRLLGSLNIIFTFGLALVFEHFITQSIPEEFKLFSMIEHYAGFTMAIVAFIVIMSFFSYWEHRVWHTKLFWPIHRFHHSATEFNALTNTRVHFTEVLLSPLFYTLPVSLLGAPLEFIFYYLAFIQYQGFMSHIDEETSYGWIGRYLWTDPVYHKLHHSSALEHMNKNFSGTLPVWDKLFGTFAYDVRPLTIGVSDGEHYEKYPYWKICIKDFVDFLFNIKVFVRKIFTRRGDSIA